jgi:hypothetical protein
VPSRGLHSTAERHRRPPDQQTISVLLNDIGRVAVVQFSLRPKGPWVADNLDQRIARLPAIAYGFVVRWTVPEMRSMAQFLLVLSGVLLGTAATLLIEFLLPRRAAEKAEAATDASREIQETSLELLRETQLLLARAGGVASTTLVASAAERFKAIQIGTLSTSTLSSRGGQHRRSAITASHQRS